MISCELMGGLGNQLFQIFTTISYAIHHKRPFKFLYKDFLDKRPTYWNTFLSSLKIFTIKQRPVMTIVEENGFQYQPLPVPLNGENSTLRGYFQSYKYFEHYWNSLLKLIKLEEQKTSIKNKYIENYDNIVSMHFRLGDYKFLQDCHPLLKYEYYKNSVQHIIEKTNNNTLKILYFCEEEDINAVQIIINKLQEEFIECEFVKINHDIPDWEQMLMMSVCHHNIIANSSFSWWGAYFNSHEDKIVCFPDVWFGPTLSYHNLKDLFPESWTKIISDV